MQYKTFIKHEKPLAYKRFTTAPLQVNMFAKRQRQKVYWLTAPILILTIAIMLALVTPVMAQAPLGNLGNKFSAPQKNFVSPDIKWYEGHWQGMDTMELDDELKLKLGYPMGLQGIFVIEVTLNTALSGVLAGDILVAVESIEVKNLRTFQFATRKIQHKTHAAVSILRKDKKSGKAVLMRKHVYVVRGRNSLGFAQVEAAPMIVPGEFRPHGYRGPCTDCHAIGEGFQLAQDPDLITLPPPVITDVQAKQKQPHEDRGACHICHQIKKSTIVIDN